MARINNIDSVAIPLKDNQNNYFLLSC